MSRSTWAILIGLIAAAISVWIWHASNKNQAKSVAKNESENLEEKEVSQDDESTDPVDDTGGLGFN